MTVTVLMCGIIDKFKTGIFDSKAAPYGLVVCVQEGNEVTMKIPKAFIPCNAPYKSSDKSYQDNKGNCNGK